jgi:hypothetical protein
LKVEIKKILTKKLKEKKIDRARGIKPLKKCPNMYVWDKQHALCHLPFQTLVITVGWNVGQSTSRGKKFHFQ